LASTPKPKGKISLTNQLLAFPNRHHKHVLFHQGMAFSRTKKNFLIFFLLRISPGQSLQNFRIEKAFFNTTA
jgi:hypothetical protein